MYSGGNSARTYGGDSVGHLVATVPGHVVVTVTGHLVVTVPRCGGDSDGHLVVTVPGHLPLSSGLLCQLHLTAALVTVTPLKHLVTICHIVCVTLSVCH